jgi:hypothetical protein
MSHAGMMTIEPQSMNRMVFNNGQGVTQVQSVKASLPRTLTAKIKESLADNPDHIPPRSQKITNLKRDEIIKKHDTRTPNSKNGKHLVLDLDETLVHTFGSESELVPFIDNLTKEEKTRIHPLIFNDGIDNMWTYIRPHVELFLDIVFEEFESVAVWSAGTYEYVHKIVDILFVKRRPHFIMTRRDCNEIQIGNMEGSCRFKPLENIYSARPEYNRNNTLILDDRSDICGYNCLNNIKIPEFSIDAQSYSIMVGDFTLITLLEWFQSESFRKTKCVRELKSKSPFKI